MRNFDRILTGLQLVALILVVVSCGEDTAPVAPSASPGIDTSPPEQIVDPSLSYPVVGESAVLTWIAPRDNDRVAAYDIRYSYSFPLDWELSLRAAAPPTPSAPGVTESYSIEAPNRGRDLYAAVRSVDASGNLSPVSNVAHTRILGHKLEAYCVVATTGAPIEGLAVTVTARHVFNHVSDADGLFVQEDLTAGAVNVAVRPGTSGEPFHHVDHTFALEEDVSLLYNMIPYEPTTLGVYETLLQLFKEAASLTGSKYIFKKWYSIPVDIYIPDFVNANGIDYGSLGRNAVARWEERTGIDLFEVVSSPPDTGVVVVFKTRQEMSPHIGITHRTNDADGFPLRDEVNIVDDFNSELPYFTVMLHELGHTIRLEHLPPGYLMYGGQPLPSDITDDEVRAVQLHTALPNGLDIGIYDDTIPPEARN